MRKEKYLGAPSLYAKCSRFSTKTIKNEFLIRVGNFRQKNYSAEDGKDGTNG